MRVRTGIIRYTGGPAGSDPIERGEERFTYSVNDNGTRQLRSMVRVFDSIQVVRDVATTFDMDWRPLDAFVRLSCAVNHTGLGWYLFENNRACFRGWTNINGHDTVDRDLPGPVIGFNAHNVAGEAALLATYDHGLAQQVQHPARCFVSSDHPRGATGPTLIDA